MSRKVQPVSRHAVKRALDCGEDGYPKLPLPRQQGAKLADKKELIRAFMTRTYRKCYVTILECVSYQVVGQDSGNEKAVIPWGDLARRTSEYIKAEYIPDGIVFRDPSHLREDDVTALLSHWYERQQEASKVLRFQRVLGPENELIEPKRARAAHTRTKVNASRGARSRLGKKGEAEVDELADNAGGDGKTGKRSKQTKRHAVRRRVVMKGKEKMNQGGGSLVSIDGELRSTTSGASTPEWESDCEDPPETKRATVIKSAAGPGRSSQGFSLAQQEKMTTPVNDVHHGPTLPTPDLTPMPQAKDSVSRKPSNQEAAKTARKGSRTGRNPAPLSSVKDEPEISSSETQEPLEPELQCILAKYDQLPEVENPAERPRPRPLRKSKQDVVEGKRGEKRDMIGDMRLRSASKPRRSPRKH